MIWSFWSLGTISIYLDNHNLDNSHHVPVNYTHSKSAEYKDSIDINFISLGEKLTFYLLISSRGYDVIWSIMYHLFERQETGTWGHCWRLKAQIFGSISSVSAWSGSGIILVRNWWRQAPYIVWRAGTIEPTRLRGSESED